MFKTRTIIRFSLGAVLSGFGLFIILSGGAMHGVIPLLIGLALIYLGLSRSRIGTLVFGHACILAGCYLITWGIYLLPYSEPKFEHIFFRPLFWGIFSIMGGICAIFHGFCNCVLKRTEDGKPLHS